MQIRGYKSAGVNARGVGYVAALLLTTWITAHGTSPLYAQVRLPAVLGDHAVLQRDRTLPVWGWTTPGDRVVVSFGQARVETESDAEGRWRVELPPMPASAEPRTLRVDSEDGSVATARDVLVGEVWLCSGQSNMDWKMRNVADARNLLDRADRPHIRFLQTQHVASPRPRQDVDARWRISTQESASLFSGVAYLFAVELYRELGVPIGILQSSVGGTRIEAWTPRQAFTADNGLETEEVWLSTADEVFRAAEDRVFVALRDWLERTAELRAASGRGDLTPPPSWPEHDAGRWNRPGSFFNGMVHGLAPYAIRGFVFYQGESNKGEGDLYARRFAALIASWRAQWQDTSLPFFFVQLAPYDDHQPEKYPVNALPWVWDAQVRIDREVPDTEMIVITDHGNLRDIHPREKLPVAKRLARRAFDRVYGRKLGETHGPRWSGMSIEGSSVVLSFDHAEGLSTRDGLPPDHFAVAARDGVFQAARATIEGTHIRVAASEVENPVAVRFAWHQAAEPNLINAAGLPATPFRTDDWPEPFFTRQRLKLPLWTGASPLSLPNLPTEYVKDDRVWNVSRSELEFFLPNPAADGLGALPRPAVLIFPGGAYQYLTIEKEGRIVARKLNEHGIAAAVVKYRVAPHHRPVPQLDAIRAVRLARHHAEVLGFDSDKIGVLGFSAGGHAASCASTAFDEGRADAADPVGRRSSRPDFSVLAYPVISMEDGVTHRGSRRVFLADVADDASEQEAWSTDRRVTPRTPPAFLVHCADDGVSVENSDRYAAALRAHGVPYEFLRPATGGHGFGLGPADHPAAGWIDSVAEWIWNLP
ncbi:MAG: sialate O-acetylesterase [Planctomycetota bacterium]